MKIADGPDAYGYTIFCDDIRFEVNGKLTYVGVYSKTLLVNGPFPFTMPRFAVDIVYLQRLRTFMRPDRFIIALPGETEDNPSIKIDIPEHDSPIEGDDGALIRIGGPFTFSDLSFPQAGALKVRVTRGDELIRLGALEIAQMPDTETKEAAN